MFLRLKVEHSVCLDHIFLHDSLFLFDYFLAAFDSSIVYVIHNSVVHGTASCRVHT